jgi:hypothetical protein
MFKDPNKKKEDCLKYADGTHGRTNCIKTNIEIDLAESLRENARRPGGSNKKRKTKMQKKKKNRRTKKISKR